jgi:hypothetical protein
MKAYPCRLHHDTPGWVKDGAEFHLRVRVSRRQQIDLIDLYLAGELLAAARRYHELHLWWCELFLIMPDHEHAMLAFPLNSTLAKTVVDWKRGAARFQGVYWQKNFFDHRIRGRNDGAETWHYIRRNSGVKDLCSSEEDWPWWWSRPLQQGGAG